MQQARSIHDVTSAQERTLRTRFGLFIQKQGALVLLVLFCVLATARYEAFLTPENLVNVLRQNSMLGIIAVGMIRSSCVGSSVSTTSSDRRDDRKKAKHYS